MTRILLHGAGRMSRRVLALISESENYELAGLVSRTPAPDLSSAAQYTVLEDFNSTADLVIDFTLPGGTAMAAGWCARHGVALLSGTTGLTDEDIDALSSAGLKVPVLWAPNLSHGVALMTELVRRAADVLGVRAKVSIKDIHHEHKVDAPSGTALALAAAVMEGRSEPTATMLAPDGLSDTGNGDLSFTSIREGEFIGEHTVGFELPGEVLEITHKALDRDVFANGALKAGEWLVEQGPGYYNTGDWLGLN